MMIFLLILSLYSAILSTILFARWIRLIVLRKRVKKIIEKDKAFFQKQPSVETYQPTTIPPSMDEIEGIFESEVVRGFEAEIERAESEEIEESVEEREYREEEMINLKKKQRR